MAGSEQRCTCERRMALVDPRRGPQEVDFRHASRGSYGARAGRRHDLRRSRPRRRRVGLVGESGSGKTTAGQGDHPAPDGHRPVRLGPSSPAKRRLRDGRRQRDEACSAGELQIVFQDPIRVPEPASHDRWGAWSASRLPSTGWSSEGQGAPARAGRGRCSRLVGLAAGARLPVAGRTSSAAGSASACRSPGRSCSSHR